MPDYDPSVTIFRHLTFLCWSCSTNFFASKQNVANGETFSLPFNYSSLDIFCLVHIILHFASWRNKRFHVFCFNFASEILFASFLIAFPFCFNFFVFFASLRLLLLLMFLLCLMLLSTLCCRCCEYCTCSPCRDRHPCCLSIYQLLAFLQLLESCFC